MPETRIHPETGSVLRRGVKRRKITYKGVEEHFDLPGWWPSDESDAILESDDLKALDSAFNTLRAEVDALPTPDAIRRIRTRLKLSQRKAGELLGGGPRSFQKYESGEIVVSRPMANLLLLLDRDPSRLKELIAGRAA